MWILQITALRPKAPLTGVPAIAAALSTASLLCTRNSKMPAWSFISASVSKNFMWPNLPFRNWFTWKAGCLRKRKEPAQELESSSLQANHLHFATRLKEIYKVLSPRMTQLVASLVSPAWSLVQKNLLKGCPAHWLQWRHHQPRASQLEIAKMISPIEDLKFLLAPSSVSNSLANSDSWVWHVCPFGGLTLLGRYLRLLGASKR